MGKNRNQNSEPGTAPYNFVPLNQQVVRAVKHVERLPDHNTFVSENYSFHGYIDVQLETLSPTFVRAPQTDEQLQSSTTTPDFFHLGDPQSPFIPGSTLRGMLRSLVEIVSHGKMGHITNNNLFFRTVDNSVIGLEYRSRMVGQDGGQKKVETGFLQYNTETGQYYIKTCEMVRVPKDMLPREHVDGNTRNPNAKPNWKYQHQLISVHRNGWRVNSVDMNARTGDLAILVISGNAPRKKKEFAFLLPTSDADEIIVSDELLDRFHDDDQITQWQEGAFPKNKPEKNKRRQNGWLENEPIPNPNENYFGDPVFFLRETMPNNKQELTFLGRAQMFRLPYLKSPYDLLPWEHRYAALYNEDESRIIDIIDFAEAMFGYVREDREFMNFPKDQLPGQNDKRRAYAGRVFVSDARPQGKVKFYSQTPVTPHILSSPKPTAFQKYLEQPTDDSRRMQHYDSPNATPRGHKGYWHQGVSPDFIDKEAKSNSTQHTQMKPIAAENVFTFRIRFEALNVFELGALLWALKLPGKEGYEYAHHLGMGKSLGLGSVKLTPSLHIIDREGTIREDGIGRYHKLFHADDSGQVTDWHQANEDFTHLIDDVVNDFERYMLKKLKLDVPRLRDVERIGELLQLMQWRELSQREQEVIQDEGWQSGRRRLPRPSEVFED